MRTYQKNISQNPFFARSNTDLSALKGSSVNPLLNLLRPLTEISLGTAFTLLHTRLSVMTLRPRNSSHCNIFVPQGCVTLSCCSINSSPPSRHPIRTQYCINGLLSLWISLYRIFHMLTYREHRAKLIQ